MADLQSSRYPPLYRPSEITTATTRHSVRKAEERAEWYRLLRAVIFTYMTLVLIILSIGIATGIGFSRPPEGFLALLPGVVTAIAAVLGYLFGVRAKLLREETNKEGHGLGFAFADALNQSVAQLASEEEIIRVGGIYSLEVWSEQSPDASAIVADTLVSFIRTSASKQPTDRKLKRVENSKKPRQDIQAAMRVLGRLPKAARELAPRYDLSDLDLRGLELRGTNFNRASFDSSWIVGADLSGASLSGADLTGVNASRIRALGANFRGAVLERADLQEAVLAESDFTRAVMQEANLGDVFARSARFRGALLSGSKLSNADLSGADLSDALLATADLTGANLEDAILQRAYVREARFDKAILRNVDTSSIQDPDHVLAGLPGHDASTPYPSEPT